jgi:NitT/TauT family transport system substrate-binding protein
VPAQLASGQIDAGMAPSPFVQLVEADGGRQLADFVMDTGVAKMELSVIANEAFAKERGDIVAAFVAALTEAGEAANADHDSVRAVLPEALGSDERTAKSAVFETWTTKVDRATIERRAELAHQYGLVDTAPDVDAVIWQK